MLAPFPVHLADIAFEMPSFSPPSFVLLYDLPSPTLPLDH